MYPFIHEIQGAEIADRYRREADVVRMLALAPRRRAGRTTLARALRSLAGRLSRYADRLEPAPACPGWQGRAAARNVH